MINEKIILESLGFSKTIILSQKRLSSNLLNSYCKDLFIVSNLEELNNIETLAEYNLVIEEDELIYYLSNLEELTNNFKQKILVLLTNQGTQLSEQFNIKNQGTLDRLFLNQGFRLNENNCNVEIYNYRKNSPFATRSIYKKIPEIIYNKYPEDYLLKNRELHMDMLREPGARSDAHVVRYALASQLIKKGDKVLDCACGLGYGTSILATTSRGKSFIGVDIETSSINYANEMYSINNVLSYKQGNAEDLSFLDDNSIDFIVSFETIEHVPDYKLLLQEFFRVLSPGGRIIMSAPNMWVDETGKDPNPYHFHEFDYKKLEASLANHNFLIESSYLHLAPGGPTNFSAKRELLQVPLGHQYITPEKSDWINLLAMKSPYEATNEHYSYTPYPNSSDEYICTKFEDFYLNPWIYRSLIQLGERFTEIHTHNKLLQEGLKKFKKDISTFADYGACLTVYGYNLLSKQNNDEYSLMIDNILEFLSCSTTNLHVYRWQISSAFLGAKLAKKLNLLSVYIDFLHYITHSEPEKFSPLLVTKKVNAFFYLGLNSLQDENKEKAKKYFVDAIQCGSKALQLNQVNSIGDLNLPNLFGFSELAELSDMLNSCSVALNEIDMYDINPAKYFQILDIKRFSLLTWNQEIEKFNAILLKEIAKKHLQN